MQLHALEPPFKIFYWFACEKLQTNIIYFHKIWKIYSKRLEKFKHSNGLQNLIVKSFTCSFSLQFICLQNSRFTKIISH